LRKKEKRPTALPSGPGSIGRSIQPVKQEHSDSETDSSDYDSDEESDEEPEVSPLPAQRSDDPREGVRYDTIKALWESLHAGVAADRIRTGMVDFNEVVQTVKNRWKADSLALTDATDRKRNSELALLRSRVNDQLEVLKIALQTAIEHGNSDIMAQ
jgi:hypothetical protein